MYNVGRRWCCVVGGWACLFFRLVSRGLEFPQAFRLCGRPQNPNKKILLFLSLGNNNRFSRATREPPPPPPPPPSPPSPPSPSNNTRRKRVFNFFLRTTTTSCRRGQNDTTLAEENRRKSSSTRMNSRLEWNASSSEIISRTFRE